MTESEKNVMFVSKLVELTQKGELMWKPADAPDEYSTTAFIAKVNERPIRIYKFTKQVSVSPTSLLGAYFPDSLASKAVTISGSVIDIMDQYNRVLYSFNDVTGTRDLYESASRSAANIDSLIESVLSHS